MSGTVSAIAAGFLLVLPVLLAVLGFTALGRDRLSAGVLLAVLAVFALSNAVGLNAPEPGSALSGEPIRLWLLLWVVAASGLALRLYRDRRLGHVRTTLESLVVLASGAILLATLVSLPTILAELARLQPV